MGKALVIVESPAKARTIGGMLGPDFIVESSIGHIRDLPRGADEVPAAYKGESWARLGVDVDNGFKPLYVVSVAEEVGGGQPQETAEGRRRAVPRHGRGPRGRVDRVASLRGAVADRARSSAWCSTRSRRPPSPAPSKSGATSTAAWWTHRRRAASSTASTATRSPPCCGARSCRGCRPAGCRAWPPAWWSSASGPACASAPPPGGASTAPSPTPRPRPASAPRWSAWAGPPSPPARTSTSTGSATGKSEVRVLGEDEATSVATALVGRSFTVSAVTERPFRRSPAAPFMTSTLQQEAGPQAALQRAAGHAGGPAPLRAGLHHLHAHRLDDACRTRR